jgi:hypothetical protein
LPDKASSKDKVSQLSEGQDLDGGKFLMQLLKIVCGFILGLMACGIFLAWGIFQSAHPNEDPVAFATMIGTGLVGASVIGATAFVPAALLILVAEIARFRGIVFHVAAAGLVAFLLWTLGTTGNTTEIRPGSAVALSAGFLAGAVYWLIAGRTSGSWHGNQRRKTEPPTGNSD